MTADRALGATTAGIIISNGATLDVNDFTPGPQPIVVSGAGTTGQGAIIDSTAGTGVDTTSRNVTLAGDTVFGVPNGGRWDIRARSSTGPGPGLMGNGFNLTKVGSGTLSIACQRNIGAGTPYWNMNLGDVFVAAGSLAFAESLTLGNPLKQVVIYPGANLQLYDLNITNPFLRNITMTNASLTCGGGNVDTNIVNGSIALTGVNSIKPDQGVFILNGPIIGSGTLNMSANDPGRVFLNGANTFPGDLTVTNGTLGGTGSLAGNLVMLGGTNSPGYGGVGTFTVNGSVTLAGTTVMEIDRNASPNKSDQLVAGGALNFGGILQVVLGPGATAPQSGDVYQLFNKGGAGSFSAISVPTLGTGQSWVTTNLGVNGSISVVGPANPPIITSVSVSGTSIVFSGTGGTQGNPFTVLSATNVLLSVTNWDVTATSTFGPGGSFSVTNAIAPGSRVYRLRVP
jgi:autotransporter-associated beta strand protein